MIEIEVNKEMIINDACKVYEKYSAINSKIYYNLIILLQVIQTTVSFVCIQ